MVARDTIYMVAGIILLIVVLLAPFYVPWNESNYFITIFSVIIWVFLTIMIIVSLIIPKKYKSNVFDFISNTFEKILESLH